jgi:hypothetical protein
MDEVGALAMGQFGQIRGIENAKKKSDAKEIIKYKSLLYSFPSHSKIAKRKHQHRISWHPNGFISP